MAKSAKGLAGIARGGSGGFASAKGLKAVASTNEPASLASVARGGASDGNPGAEARAGDTAVTSSMKPQNTPAPAGETSTPPKPKAGTGGDFGATPAITPSMKG